MPHARDIIGYPLSKDYALLAQLMLEQSVICIVDYQDVRDVAQTLYSEYGPDMTVFQVSARGISYVYAHDIEEFKRMCMRYRVEFIVPTEPPAVDRTAN